MRFLKYLPVIFAFLSVTAFGQWHTTAPYQSFPVTNVTYFPGISTSGTVTRAFGSDDVTMSSTSWGYHNSNFPMVTFRYYQPQVGLWGAYAEKLSVVVKTALPNLPSNTVAVTVSTNTCIVGAVTNVCQVSTITRVNYQYLAPDDTNTVTAITITTNGCAICIVSNNFTTISIAPCPLANIVTNAILETNCYQTVASLTNPGLVATLKWGNTDFATACASTNIPQIIAISYRRIGPGTNFVSGGTNVFVLTSHFLPTTNFNLNAPQIWPFDTTLAENEREQVLNHSLSWQNIPSLDPTQTGVLSNNLPLSKAWILANASQFLIKKFSDNEDGVHYTNWCRVRMTPWATGATHTNLIYDGATLTKVIITNGWYGTNAISYPPPTYGQYLFTDSYGITRYSVLSLGKDGISMSPTSDYATFNGVAYNYFAVPLTTKEKLCVALGLPYQTYPIVLTNNFYGVPGWQVGVFTPSIFTNITRITTSLIIVADYFSYTPTEHHANGDKGLGHLTTNQWSWRNIWLQFARVNYSASEDGGGTGGWSVVAAPVTPYDVTNTVMAVTNGLTIKGNTHLSATGTYSPQFWGQTFTVIAYNDAAYTRQAASLTNFTVITTNLFSSPIADPDQTNIVSCAVTNCVISTNAFTFSPSVFITNVFNGMNRISRVSYSVPNIITQVTVCCMTNTSTAVVTSPAVTSSVAIVSWQATNVASVAFQAIRLDYASATQFTNTISGTTTTEVRYIASSYSNGVNSTVLLSNLFSSAVNYTNLGGVVFTNWSVAAGKTEQDYEYDAAKLGLNEFTSTLTNLTPLTTLDPFFYQFNWVGSTKTLSNRYGTVDIASLVDTNFMGYFLPASVTTDTLAHAESQYYFARGVPSSGYGYETPYGYNVAYPIPQVAVAATQFRKDRYNVTGFIFYSYYPNVFHVCSTDNIVYQTDPDTGATNDCFCAVYPNQDYTIDGTDCGQIEAALAAIGALPQFGTMPLYIIDNPFGAIGINQTYDFWHGLTPFSDKDLCCNDGVYSLVHFKTTWTMTSNDFHNSSTVAWSADGALPTLANDVVTAAASKLKLVAGAQSSAGVFTDISKAYESVRGVYVRGNLDVANINIGYDSAAINTNLPVTASTNMVNVWFPIPITFGDYACSNFNNFYSAPFTPDYSTVMRQVYYQSLNHTYPTNSLEEFFYDPAQGSNVYQVVTNLYWPLATVQWTAPTGGGIDGAWDTAANVGKFTMIPLSTATANITTLTTFLNTTMMLPLPGAVDSQPRGWGLDRFAVYVIMNYAGTTNGMPHR